MMRRLVIWRHPQSLIQKCKGERRFFKNNMDRLAIEKYTDESVPLSPEGHRELIGTIPLLLRALGPFDLIVQSKMRRSEQMARLLKFMQEMSLGKRVPILTSALLNERNCGQTFLMTEDEIEVHYPGFKEYWENEREVRARYPGGENLLNVFDRFYELLAELKRDYAGKNICLCSHWGTQVAARHVIDGLDENDLLALMGQGIPGNCVTAYEASEAGDRLILRGAHRLLTQQESP